LRSAASRTSRGASHEAEAALGGRTAYAETFRKAADIALGGAHGYKYNAFQIELANNASSAPSR
jgi:hypothetical protein